jgi:hypothetical protein
MRYVAVSETEELICDSDTEEQCLSLDTEVEAADDLSDDSDSSVLTGHLCGMIVEAKTGLKSFHCSQSRCELSCCTYHQC